MKKKDFAKKSGQKISELKSLAEEKRQEIVKAKLEITTNREKDLKKAKNLKHELAQILTIIRQKEIEEAEGVKKAAGVEEKTKKVKSKSK